MIEINYGYLYENSAMKSYEKAFQCAKCCRRYLKQTNEYVPTLLLEKEVDSINETDYGRNTKLPWNQKRRRLGCKKKSSN